MAAEHLLYGAPSGAMGKHGGGAPRTVPPLYESRPRAAGLEHSMRQVTKMIKIAPSILSADFTRLGEEVSAVLQAKADYIHVDVMDGVFVPNITIGVPVVRSLRRAFPDAFLDVHLMITQPGRFTAPFCDAGADLFTMHVEADTPENITAAIRDVHAHGCRAGLALRPGTPAETAAPWIRELELVLEMTVEPGFGGQGFMPETLPKIEALRAMIERENPACELEVDGGIAPDTAPLVIAAGADVLVAGSAVFGKSDYASVIRTLRGV